MAGEVQPKKKLGFAMLKIVVMVVVGLILVGGVSYFVAIKVMAVKSPPKEAAVETHDPGAFIKLGDPKEGLLVNIGGTGGRYLKISVVLEMKPNKGLLKEGKNLSPTETKIQDAVVQLLRSQKIENFDPAKQNVLKAAIKNEVDGILGEDSVYEVYITNIILQ